MNSPVPCLYGQMAYGPFFRHSGTRCAFGKHAQKGNGSFFWKQDQYGEVGHVAEDAGDGEADIRGTLQRSRRRAVLVEALKIEGAVGLGLEDLVHFSRLLS